MININGETSYTIEETKHIISEFIYRATGQRIIVDPKEEEKELFERAATVAINAYENGWKRR